jgi:hypothetical protein
VEIRDDPMKVWPPRVEIDSAKHALCKPSEIAIDMKEEVNAGGEQQDAPNDPLGGDQGGRRGGNDVGRQLESLAPAVPQTSDFRSFCPRLRCERGEGLRQLASWTDGRQEDDDGTRRMIVCLACGTPLQKPLTYLGSLRCMDCRSVDRQLDPRLVQEWQAGGAHLH